MKQAPLHTRLRRARKLLGHWRRAAYIREQAQFEEAIKALTEAIKLARTPQLGPPPGKQGGLTQCDMHEDESI